MNYDELMQDFEISLIETLNEKEKELSDLSISEKDKLERFLIKLKFHNNTVDISNCGDDDLKDFIYNLANLNNEEKGLLYLQCLYFENNYADSRVQLLSCQNVIGIIRILFKLAESFENSNNKMHFMECIFKFITTNLKDINFDMQSFLENFLNANYRHYKDVKDSILYMVIISSVARLAATTAKDVFDIIEEMKKYPEVEELVEDYKRRKVELELQQKHEQEARTI